ncbi:hypothetical protein PhCBS80983_g05458 [Powellomyces hirtus]|uniref:Uncharacterized protein n=1 Tax=Powellomyces hirtus TaxID=109895 RepID=A0A507DU54_9FUNG|nr:hypothetical protein PhCBS80983_g05458 [Powellomyces hirtus]
MDPHSTDLSKLWPDVSSYILNRDQNIRSLPVTAPLAAISAELPTKSAGPDAAFQLFKTSIAPHVNAACGPRYFGFITGGVTPAAHIGDVLATSFDQNVMTASESAGSAAADVEEAVVVMLRDLLHLPAEYEGIITAGGTSSNTLALAVARQWVGRKNGVDIGEDGLQALGGKAIRVFGTMAHQSISKAMSTLGLGRKVVQVPPLPGTVTQMDPEALDKALSLETNNGGTAGCIVVVQSGEVNTSNCDSLPQISAVCKRHNAWLHVDGAANLLARASPTHAQSLEGLELADSITGDCHKWFNVPYDSGLMLTRHPAVHSAAITATAAYLAATTTPAYAPINLSLDNSRRFRALPLWMALQAYGREGFAEIVDRTCDFAAQLGAWIRQSQQYELLQPPCLNTVLFRVVEVNGEEVDPEMAKRVLQHVNATRKVFFSGTVWQGKPAIRAAIANWRTNVEDDLQIVAQSLTEGYAAAFL